MIKEERRAGNPVAALIHSLQLDQNRAVLLLSNLLDDEEEVPPRARDSRDGVASCCAAVLLWGQCHGAEALNLAA